MDNYNRMADRMNSLIDTAYRCRLKEQKMDIARQNAELMALYSQINPHFLFNALESIRMHSILKKEEETANMIQKLAIMVRQNVDWSSDSNTIKRELAFVEAYLSLQKISLRGAPFVSNQCAGRLPEHPGSEIDHYHLCGKCLCARY